MAKSTTSNLVGPIIFANETARTQLKTEGEVVTFRKSSRTTGDTWWRESRFGGKQGDVTVEEIGEANPLIDQDLARYRDLSGFESIDDWRSAISSLNGDIPNSGYLYRVTIRES